MANDPYADLRAQVLNTIIIPDLKSDTQDVVTWRRRWRKLANWAEGTAHIFLGLATVIAFAAGFFVTKYISFAAGCCTTICLVLLRFSTYANTESEERNIILARLMVFLGLTPVPSITPDIEARQEPALAQPPLGGGLTPEDLRPDTDAPETQPGIPVSTRVEDQGLV